MTARIFTPHSLGVWLDNIDVNSLSDDECDVIASVDVEDDAQLAWLVSDWIRQRYLRWDAFNKSEMRSVLEQSIHWSEKDMRSAFDEYHLPSGQKIKNIERFMKALRDEFLR